MSHTCRESAAYPPLTNLGIDITGRCNLHCRHCFNRSGGSESRELSVAVITRFLDEAYELGCRYVRLSGGEPTLHEELRQVIDIAVQRGYKVGLNTNGVWSDAVYTALHGAPVDHFIVSLDGLRDTSDAIRGNGTFDRSLGSVRWLMDRGITVTLGVHVRRSNLDEIEELVAMAADLGIGIKFSPLRPIGRAQELPAEMLSPDLLAGVVRRVTGLRERYPQIRITTDFDILAPGAATRPVVPNKERCMAGCSACNLHYDGYIYPCAFLVTPEREFAAARFGDASLAEIWTEAPVFLQLRNRKASSRCLECAVYRRACNGGCPAMAYSLSGDLTAHDPTCFIDIVSVCDR